MRGRRELARVALGEIPADRVIRGGRLVNVYTGEIYPADVAIKGNRIAAVGDVEKAVGPDTEIIDAQGAYLCPGFIETHMHVGSAQLSMTELARVLVSRGTAAIATDFHESGIVGGVEAMRFLADEMARTPLRLLFTPFVAVYLASRASTGNVNGHDLLSLLDWPECVGVREWQVHGASIPDPHAQRFFDEAERRNLVLDGHLEGLAGADLQASVALRADSDHEMATADEVLERVRLGVYPCVRWGASTWDLEPIIREVVRRGIPTHHLTFSTDDQDGASLIRDGHMDHKIRMAIRSGLDPVAAVQMASLNGARLYRVERDLGAIAPGRLAYVVIVPDLREFTVQRVIADGRLVAEDGRYIASLTRPQYPRTFYGTVRLLRPLEAEDFAVRAPAGAREVRIRVIGQREGSIITEMRTATVPVRDGLVEAGDSLAKVAVIERHRASGQLGVGFIEGFGLKRGALAMTYNPGVCNLAVIGMNDGDMAVAANRAAELGGGLVVVRDGEVVAEAPLPLQGLYSDLPLEEAGPQLEAVDRALRDELGSPFRGFIIALGFACLGVTVPGLKITAHGLVYIENYRPEPVDLFV